MNEEDKRLKSELITAGSAVGGREAAMLLHDDLAEIPMGEALTAFIPRLPMLAIAAWSKEMQRRSTNWQRGVYREYGHDPVKVKEEIITRILKDPRAGRVLIDSYNTLLEADDPAVIPTLAATGAYYLKHGGADVFCRRFLRFLKDLSAPMYGMTRRLFDALAEVRKRLPAERATLIEIRIEGDAAVLAYGQPDVNVQHGQSPYREILERWPLSDQTVALAVLDLLKQHRIAWMGAFSSDNDNYLIVEGETIAHVRMLLREPGDEESTAR